MKASARVSRRARRSHHWRALAPSTAAPRSLPPRPAPRIPALLPTEPGRSARTKGNPAPRTAPHFFLPCYFPCSQGKHGQN